MPQVGVLGSIPLGNSGTALDGNSVMAPLPTVITVPRWPTNCVRETAWSLRDAIVASETRTSVDGSVVGTGNDIIRFAAGLSGAIDFSLVGDNSFGPSALLINDNLTIQAPTRARGSRSSVIRRRRRSVCSTSPSAPA